MNSQKEPVLEEEANAQATNTSRDSDTPPLHNRQVGTLVQDDDSSSPEFDDQGDNDDDYSEDRSKSKRFNCRRRNPRCWSILVSILFPLWVLISISLLGGRILADQEGPNEVDSNDEIMEGRFLLETFGVNENLTDSLLKLPQFCYQQFLLQKILDASNLTEGIDTTTFSEEDLPLEDPPAFVPPQVNFPNFLRELNQHMAECGSTLEAYFNLIMEFRDQTAVSTIVSPLTFDWIRCWNETELGARSRVWRPTNAQLGAAANQALYFEAVWRQHQQELYGNILFHVTNGNPENATIMQRVTAMNVSAVQATGGSGCSVNSAGTAWFWFTVMTTIGYGNQAPTTTTGRTMVALLGFVSIVLFAGILANAGSIVNVIWDDFVGRIKKFPMLKTPVVGAVVWGGVTCGWIFYLALLARRWWSDRLEGEYDATTGDSIWFAFITTTTVGLGDYFLPPQVIFVGDVFRFSSLVLIGFVFLSTFLGQFSALLAWVWAPVDAGERLKHDLKETRLLYAVMPDIFGEDEKNQDDDAANAKLDQATVDTLKKLLENQRERELDHPHLHRDLLLLQEEQDLLQRLINRNRKQQRRQVKEEIENGGNVTGKPDATGASFQELGSGGL